MIFRVFYQNTYKDISLDATKRFSVGSGKNDDIFIPDSQLKKEHVIVALEKDGWKLRAKTAVLYKGNSVTETSLELNTAVGISEDDNISMFCINDFPRQPTIIGIDNQDEISVGSAQENTIMVRSRFVSKRHLTLKKSGTGYRLVDLGSTNGTYVNGIPTSGCILNIQDEIVFGDARIIFTGRSLEIYYESNLLRLIGLDKSVRDYKKSVVYKRSPRLKMGNPTKVVEIENPPALGGKPEINWLSTLLPAFSTAGIAIVMASVMGNVMMLLYSLPMTVIGLILSFTNFYRQKKKYREQEKLRLDMYSEHLNRAIEEIERCQEQQLCALEASDPDVETCLSIARDLDRRLWQRRATDDDFLCVRLGSGKVLSCADIHITKATLSLEEDELAAKPQRIYEKYRMLDGAPITCDIFHAQICGIVGRHEEAVALLNNMLLQIATHHCYTDVKTILIYDRADENQVSWASGLPHAANDERTVTFSATTKLETAELLKNFVDALKERKYLREAEDSYGTPAVMLPYYLFVLLQPAYLDKSNPINDFILKSKNLSTGVIMVVDNVAQLPPECNLIIELNPLIDRLQGKVYRKENTALQRYFAIDKCRDENYTLFAEMLSQVSCEAESTSASLPKSLSFFEMMGISNIGQWDIGAHWASSNVIDTMAAPLGIMESGDILELDLHEKAHGPHGIVAGTTGSGKSELLVSYILAMAMKYSPYEVGFVIIDFKGGGMVNRLAGLPHLIGSITDIDGDGIDRSLASIKAELNKRKRIFSESNLKDNTISEYIKKYKCGDVGTPLPHLIIIVDEFAELKQNQPEFMKELISASRIGRSLGIHLILATQQPGGQVSGEIWTNSRFQISLRAASAEDSNEVIKSPLAFSIKEPGRAYVRVGNNEIFEQVQSGYSKVRSADGSYQFEEVIHSIQIYCQNYGVEPLENIYLPALPEKLEYEKIIDCVSHSGSIMCCVGMYDAPDQQKQGHLLLNLSTANTIVIGSPQRGKTNLLQTIIRNVAQQYSPEQVNLYILDFGSTILKNFSELNHVGGVVTAPEDEKMENLFKLIVTEMEHRKKLFSEQGVSSFSAYLEAGFQDLPQIILLIDNFTVMQELYPDECDLLIGISREGLAVGISIVLANAQTGGLGFKYLMNFSCRIALHCNDGGEYSQLFERQKLSIRDVPGRALAQVDHQVVESQIYLGFSGEREIDRVSKMREFVTSCNMRYCDSRARQIPQMPDCLSIRDMEANGYNVAVKDYVVPIGVDYANLEVVHIDMLKQGILGISGTEQSGKTNLVRHIIISLQSNILDNIASVYIADGAKSLNSVYECGCVEEVTSSALEAEAMIDSVYEELLERKNSPVWDETAKEAPLLILVLSGEEMVAQLLQNQKVNDKLQSIGKELKKYKGFVLLEDIENQAINYASPGLLKYLKENHSFFVLDNIDNINLFDIPIKLIKTFSKEIRLGDGYSFIGGRVKRIHTILADSD